MLAHPVGGDGVGLDTVWIQFRRNAEPWQDLADISALQMRVQGRAKVPAEAIDPIGCRPKKTAFRFGFLFPVGMGDIVVVLLRLPGLIENGRIIAAVEGDVGFHEKVIREQLAAFAKQECQHAFRR